MNMPNYCDYSLRVQGKPDNVEEVVKTIQAKYSYDTMEFDHKKHLFRVFTSFISDDDEPEEGIRSVIIDGECAWSVSTCMTEIGYYKEAKEEYGNNFRGTTLKELTKATNTMIEVYSEEYGSCFQEHYLYKNGICIIGDYVPFYEITQTRLMRKRIAIEDYIQLLNRSLKKKHDWDEWIKRGGRLSMNDVVLDGNTYIIGGFKHWDFSSFSDIHS